MKNIKSTVSAVTMQTASAVIKMVRVDFRITLRFGCRDSSLIFLNPEPKFMNVAARFERKRLFLSCSSTEQQSSIMLPEPYLYLPIIVTNVVKLARHSP